jgi:hypothetical protein
VLLGRFGVAEQLLDRMDCHHALGRELRVGIEILVVRVEGDRHHVGPERHQLDLLLEPGAGDAELHHRIRLLQDRLLQRLPALVMDLRDLLAVRLHRLLERAAPVDVGDRGARLDAVDVLLRHAGDILLRRAQVVDRVGGARIARDRDDQFFHGSFLAAYVVWSMIGQAEE